MSKTSKTAQEKAVVVEEAALENLDIDQTKLNIRVVDLPMPDFMQAYTTAKTVGEFLGWKQDGEVYKALKINRKPVERVDKFVEVGMSPEERKGMIYAALDVCMGIWKDVSMTTHIVQFDETAAVVPGAKFVLDRRTNTWIAYDWYNGAGYVKAERRMSPGLSYKNWALNLLVSGQQIFVSVEIGKENYANFIRAVCNSPLGMALEHRDASITQAREDRWLYNYAKAELAANGVPSKVIMTVDEKPGIDLMKIDADTKFTVINAEGKALKNVTWRKNREGKVIMFAGWAKQGYRLESGWNKKLPDEQ